MLEKKSSVSIWVETGKDVKTKILYETNDVGITLVYL